MKKFISISLVLLSLVLVNSVLAQTQHEDRFYPGQSDSKTEQYNKDCRPTCTCFGGPGNYSYQCQPVAKTCYGGPGNYPYTCWVCPQ